MPGFGLTQPAVVPVFGERDGDKIPIEQFTVDCSSYRPAKNPENELVERKEGVFKEIGVVRLTNTGVTNAEVMKRYAKVILKGQMEYEGGGAAREALAVNVFEVGAPHDARLHYHNEMAYNAPSMKNMAFCSIKTPAGKGDTYLSESTPVTDELMRTDLGRSRNKGRPTHNHWQLRDPPSDAGVKASPTLGEVLATHTVPTRDVSMASPVSEADWQLSLFHLGLPLSFVLPLLPFLLLLWRCQALPAADLAGAQPPREAPGGDLLSRPPPTCSELKERRQRRRPQSAASRPSGARTPSWRAAAAI